MELEAETEITYPSSDGEPMAESTLQFDYIVLIKEGLEATFAQDEQVFVAGDLFWYPVQGNNRLRYAPDILVAFGRPKGPRKSYLQWKEDNIAPQVVFEILSEGNRPNEMTRKFAFYTQYGVEEYYVYDPQQHELAGWLRNESLLQEIEQMHGWTSPRLGTRFEMDEKNLLLFRQDGSAFKTYTQLAVEREALSQEVRLLTQENEVITQENEVITRENEVITREKKQLEEENRKLLEKLKSQGISHDEA